MVRKRSWPAVSHCEEAKQNPSVKKKQQKNKQAKVKHYLSVYSPITLRYPYNLKFYGLSVQLDGPDLEVHTDGTDIALCVRVILGQNKHTDW